MMENMLHHTNHCLLTAHDQGFEGLSQSSLVRIMFGKVSHSSSEYGHMSI